VLTLNRTREGELDTRGKGEGTSRWCVWLLWEFTMITREGGGEKEPFKLFSNLHGGRVLHQKEGKTKDKNGPVLQSIHREGGSTFFYMEMAIVFI